MSDGVAAGRNIRQLRAAPVSAILLTSIIFIAAVAAFPLVWMVLTSLETPQETMRIPPVWLPASPTLEAYWKVADVLNLGRSFLNSGIIAVVTTGAIDVTSLMAATLSPNTISASGILCSLSSSQPCSCRRS